MGGIFRKQSKEATDPKDIIFQVIGNSFQGLEKLFNQKPHTNTVADLAHLTKVITLAEEIIRLIEEFQLGNKGIIKSQSSLYLAQTLDKRGMCYFKLSFAEATSQMYHQLAKRDFERIRELNEKWGLSITISDQIINSLK